MTANRKTARDRSVTSLGPESTQPRAISAPECWRASGICHVQRPQIDVADRSGSNKETR